LHKETLPLYVKAGSIIPMQTDVPTLKQKPENVLHLHLYEGADCTFELYEDDGETFAYENKKYVKRNIIHNAKSNQLIFEKTVGEFISHYKTIRLFFHGFAAYKDSVKLNGSEQRIVQEHISFVEPLSDFDPYHKPPKDRVVIMDINTIEFENGVGEMVVSWG
jgi:alpha-glucosidase